MSETKNIKPFRVGLFSLIGILILVIFGLIQWRIESESKEIFARFTDSRGIKSGDIVEFAGVKIGRVTRVEISPENDVLVHFYIPSDMQIFSDATATVVNMDLLGGMKLDLAIGTKTSGFHSNHLPIMGLLLDSDGNIVMDIPRLLGTTSEVLSKLDKTIVRMDSMMIGQFSSVLLDISALSKKSDHLFQMVNSYLMEIQYLEKQQGKSAIKRVDEIATSIEDLVIEISEMTQKLTRKNSPLDKMVFTDSLYNQIVHTINSIDSLILDVQNHPENYLEHLDIQVRLFGSDKEK